MKFAGYVGVLLFLFNLLKSSYGSDECDFDCLGRLEDKMVDLNLNTRTLRNFPAPVPIGTVKFLLFTRDLQDTPEEYVVFSEPRDKVFNNLNPNRKTKVIIHGWKGAVPSLYTDVMKNAYLPKHDYNIIMVDWSMAGSKMLYPWAKSHIPLVAEVVAAFIDQLVMRHGIRPESLHLIGHSLGAHIAGVTARHLTTGMIGRITGLDPAEPLVDLLNPEESLSKDSAKFVDVIHTCGLYLGFMAPMGHVDFYPNGGHFIQPGCGIDTSGSCSHRRSYGYYVESIDNPDGFLAYPCSSWFRYYLGKCPDSSLIPMGEYVPVGAKGSYYLHTNKAAPFSQNVQRSRFSRLKYILKTPLDVLRGHGLQI